MAGQWRATDDLRLERQVRAVAALNERFCFIGGHSENVGEGPGMPSVEILDRDGHSLPSTAPPMLFGRFTPELAVDTRRNRIVVVGGSTSSNLRAWRHVNRLPNPDTEAPNYLDAIEANGRSSGGDDRPLSNHVRT